MANGGGSETVCCGEAALACTANSDCCDGFSCVSGACTAVPDCTVCSLCEITTVQAAIDAATAGDTITIEAGTYDEDLTVAKTLTLARCGEDGTVTLRNATTGRRTIELPYADPASGSASDLITLTLQDIVVSSTRDVANGDPGGGIYGYANLVLNGTTRVTGNKAPLTNSDAYALYGGGISLCVNTSLSPEACSLTMNDSSSVDNNFSANDTPGYGSGGYGGGIAVGGYCSVTMNQTASVSFNTSLSYGGGGIFGYGYTSVTMNGGAAVTDNASDSYGGGVYVYSRGTVAINDAAVVARNTAKTLGGGIYTDSYSTLSLEGTASVSGNSADDGGGLFLDLGSAMTMSGASTVSGNHADSYAGGIDVDSYSSLTMNDTTTITGNSSDSRAGGIWIGYNATFTTNGSASLSGNTPTDCDDSYGACP